MFNYYNPCSMFMPVPFYLKGSHPMMYPMVPMEYDCEDENDDDLNRLHPRIYFKIYPLVKKHCDIMEKEKGKDYCPC